MDGVSIQLVVLQVQGATALHILHWDQICSLQTVDYRSGQAHDHQEEYPIYIASQGHHFQDLHLEGYPKNISYPTSMEAAEPSQRSLTPPHVSDHVANQWPTTPSCQHPPKDILFYLVSMP
uniref:Uncharacterized protein n=1 Tax=Opuntia streptacantha TaxID=393608 RepID=A0A7C9A0U8_OPUST